MKAKNKGRQLTNVRKESPKKPNPFEIHINRSKHNVLGRKLKSDRGLPGISKNKAMLKRSKTLLQEYQMKDKRNQFFDQRIGERNNGMTEDDRVMARFAAERMRMFNKKAIFNLSDTEVLTHKGETLSEIERFENTRSDDEEEDEGRQTSGALKGKFVESAHFGGGMLTKGKKDRESLIEELINESKKRKAERQRNKEETLEATEQLDEEWKALGTIVTSKKDKEDENSQKNDQYDIVMRQLKFEPQGQPSQRLKTEEEVAKEEREQLEMLEKERLKQLREIEAFKHGSHKSADDLDDGFANLTDHVTENYLDDQHEEGNTNYSSESESEHSVEEMSNKGQDEEEEIGEEPEIKRSKNIETQTQFDGKNQIPEYGDAEEENKLVASDEDSNDNESSDEECAMDDLTDLMPSINNASAISPSQKTVSAQLKGILNNEVKKETSEADGQVELDLPYVLDIPESYNCFKDLLENRTIKQQNVIFERFVKSNHPSLDPGNKRKLLKLAEYVMEFVSKGDITWESMPVLVSVFNILKEFNKVECLQMLVDSLSTKLTDFADDILPIHLKYLAWYILLFLRPQGMEVLVPVNKPALILVCRLVTETHHVTVGLLCCYLLLQDAKISSIVYPEAITFLHNCIKSSTTTSNPANEKKEDDKFDTEPNLVVTESGGFKLLLDWEKHEEEDATVLHCSLVLLSDFVKVYRKYPQSKIMFKQIHTALSNMKTDTFPVVIKKKISELQTLLHVLSSTQLSSLVKTAKKPKALRQYEPSFHTVTIGKHQRDLPAEKQEEQKLLHKYKHEFKAASRELRRDRVFLANVKLREKALSDEQRMKKVKEIFGSAAAQQGELRKLKRKK